jgi:hypothetical protein
MELRYVFCMDPVLAFRKNMEHIFRLDESPFAIGVDRSDGPFRGFLSRKTTPSDLFQSTVIAKLL